MANSKIKNNSNIENIGLISDLNTLTYPNTFSNYVGYVGASTQNKPDSAGGGLVLLSNTNSTLYGSLLYITDQSLYRRTLTGGVWGNWIDIQNPPRPYVSGWQVGFVARGWGFVVIVPCDTRYYSITVNSGAKAYINNNWVDLTNGVWGKTDYGTYYMLDYNGNEFSSLTTPQPILISISTTVTKK